MKPFVYQRGVIATLNRTFQRLRQALIVMATGLGKTFTAAFWAEQHMKKGARGLFLCHETGILEQSIEAFQEALGDHFVFRRFNGGRKRKQADILFATFQAIRGRLAEFDPAEFDFVIVDESHHGKAPTFEPVIRYFKPRRLLGMTATPDRMDLADIRELFGKEVVNIPLEKAIKKGWLTPFEYHIVTDNIDQEVLNQLLEKAGHKRKRITVKEINRTIFVRARDRKIAETILGHNLKTIIFCRNIAHAERFRRFLPGAETYHSKRPEERNKATLRRFRSGECRYILTVNKFNEGMDIPDAELLVFLRTTESLTIFLQQLGRGLRLRPGKKKVLVLDFVANAERMLMLRAAMESIGIKMPGMSEREGARKPVIHLSGHGFSFEFTNRQVDLFRLLDRTERRMVSDIPGLAREYSSRNILQATQVHAASRKKLWWKCSKCEHEWQATPVNRTVSGTGCPGCSGRSPTLKKNLRLTHPHLAKEYSPRNALPATQVVAGTNKKLWWACRKCGHEWQASGGARSLGGSGCPACSRRVVTDSNNLQATHPELASEYSPRNLLQVTQVVAGTNKELWWKCRKCGQEWQATGNQRLYSNNNCPTCRGRSATPAKNLSTTHPELAKEYSLRNELPVTQVVAGTGKKLWWKCKMCDHEWQATGDSRVSRGRGCPACSGSVATSKNNLAVTHPHLATEYSRRNLFLPTRIIAGTSKKLWWKCRECGHEWQATGNSRVTTGCGCPKCSRMRAANKRRKKSQV